jgi:hypothetical protein
MIRGVKISIEPVNAKLLRRRALYDSKAAFRRKSLKTRHVNVSSPKLTRKPLNRGLPSTIEDFVAVANCVPALARTGFLWRPRQADDRDYDWLFSSSLKPFLPPKEEALTRRSYIPGQLGAEESQRPEFQFAHWLNAVRYTISLFTDLLNVRQVPDFSSKPRNAVPWSPPLGAEQIEITGGKLRFTSFEHPASHYYANLKKVLDGLEVARLRQCEAELRGGIVCGRFFYAKRLGRKASRACKPDHANLMRVKKSQRKTKGR